MKFLKSSFLVFDYESDFSKRNLQELMEVILTYYKREQSYVMSQDVHFVITLQIEDLFGDQ